MLEMPGWGSQRSERLAWLGRKSTWQAPCAVAGQGVGANLGSSCPVGVASTMGREGGSLHPMVLSSFADIVPASVPCDSLAWWEHFSSIGRGPVYVSLYSQ